MKKIICILGSIILLTACSTTTVTSDIILSDNINPIEVNRQKALFIKDDIKQVIEEINALEEKYKDEIVDAESNFVHINIYEDFNRQGIQQIEFNNKYTLSEEYFNDLVQILDNSLANGLKDYINKMKMEELKIDRSIVEKIGRAVVYVENREGDEDNYISIIINFSDIEDENYRRVFHEITHDKYILNKVIIGEKRNLVDFGNINISHDMQGPRFSEDIIIRYNIFFADEDIKKTNILIQGKDGMDLKEEDIDVFINLLNVLELNGEDKGILIKEYRDILKDKKNNKKISLENHNVFIKSNKGKIYGGKERELIFFSIEKN